MNTPNSLTALATVGAFALATDSSAPRRYWHEEPTPTRRYVKWLSMDPVEDPRLGHGAARLLQVIRSLAGRTTWLETTQAGLAKRVSRSARQIRRYLKELEQFGYIRAQKRFNRRTRMIVGLYVYLTAKVLPPFKDLRRPKPRKPDRTKATDSKVKDSIWKKKGGLSDLPEDLARALIRLGETLESRAPPENREEGGTH